MKIPHDWLKKYYPIPANHPHALRSELSAAKYSLRKWIGFLHLEEYQLKFTRKVTCIYVVTNLHQEFLHCSFDYPTTEENFPPFFVGNFTCALCIRHLEFYVDNTRYINCKDCGIYKTLKRACCDFHSLSPWTEFCETLNPKPMIQTLKQTIKFLLKNST